MNHCPTKQLSNKTSLLLDMSKNKRFLGRDCGTFENLFLAKLIPTTSSGKYGAVSKFRSEQSANSFRSSLWHLHWVMDEQFFPLPVLMIKTKTITVKYHSIANISENDTCRNQLQNSDQTTRQIICDS